MGVLKEFSADALKVRISDSRAAMGCDAALAAAACLKDLLKKQETVNMIFAAAPSQNEMLECLAAQTDIDWKRVHAFHMDEYIGLPAGAPQAFGEYLKEHIFSKASFGKVYYLDPQAQDAQAECERYSTLLKENPADIVCLGIGENGHIAFNDPWVADFEDPALVKIVPLDPVCRQQQVNDGCFATLDAVPTHAMTLTIPALAACKHMFCTVPAKSKAWAVEQTVKAEISKEIPATVMRRHADATLYCDPDSGKMIMR